MSKVLVTVFDTKAKIFNVPCVFESSEDAHRAFFDLCADTNTMIGRHPEDFILYMVGNFDVCTGVLSVLERAPIADGTEYLLARREDNGNVRD